MNKIRRAGLWSFIIFITLINSGCAIIGTALSAGMAYGIYQATKK